MPPFLQVRTYFWWHLSKFLPVQLLQGFTHDDNVFSRLAVRIAVLEHCVKVPDALLCAIIVFVLQPFLDGAKIHGMFDYFVVVLKRKK